MSRESDEDLEGWEGFVPFEPYDVECARCGKVLSCVDAIAEEGDEWECPTCWERCEAAERAAAATHRDTAG